MSVREDKNITKEALLYNDIYKYLREGAYREEATKDELKENYQKKTCEKKESSGQWTRIIS